MLLHSLDLLFLAGHCAFIAFILFGWSLRKTRRLHRWMLCLVFCSWVGFGPWFGFGYCPLTDWHWRVRAAMGDSDLPASFITYLLQRFVNIYPDPQLVDIFTVMGLLAAVITAVTLWVWEKRSQRGERPAGNQRV
jgi:hypothetical protein